VSAVSSRVTIKPIYKEVLADLETPLTAYLKVASQPAFLLESVEQGERIARYSFIGTGERLRLESRGSTMTIKSAEGTEATPLTTSSANTKNSPTTILTS
jgi:anthranilate synthase component I